MATTPASANDPIPLTEQVMHALGQHPHLARQKLRTEHVDGHVTLRGVVGSYYQKQIAQEVIRRIDGVFQIANELEVDWLK